MKPALVLKEMKELRESWRKQGFHYTTEQQKRYDELLKLRRERVKSSMPMIKYGKVRKRP